MPLKRLYPAKRKTTIGWPADEAAAELQYYRGFCETIQRFYEKERSRNTSMSKDNFLAYLDHVNTIEAENTAFGQAIMHRRRRTILNFKRRPDGSLEFGDFIMQTFSITRADMHLFEGCNPCEVIDGFCADLAMVIETLAKNIRTTSRFSAKDIFDLKNRVTELENDVNVILRLKPEVPVGDSIRTLLNRTIVACRKLQTLAEPSRRLATLTDLENLLRNLTGRKLDRTMIEQKIWSQEEQFNSLICTSEEEVTHQSRTASNLLMPPLGGIGRTISDVLSLLGLDSCFRMPPAFRTRKTSTPPQTNTEKAYSSTISPNNSTGIASLMPYLLCNISFPPNSTLENHVRIPDADKYVCTFHAYGCESIVTSKGEWKRHIKLQHMRSETWRCDIGNCALRNRAFQPPPIPMPLPHPETHTFEDRVAAGRRKRKQEQDSNPDWDLPGRMGSRKRSKPEYEETEEPANTTLRETETDPGYGWAAVSKQNDRRSSRRNRMNEDTSDNIAPKPGLDAEETHADAQKMQASPYFPQPEAPPSASSLTHPGMPEPSYHEFHRKDHFAQHLRYSHAPPSSATPAEKTSYDDAIEAAEQRCHVRLRELPTSTICPFCPDHPSFKKWEDRVNHVGNHLEKQDIFKR